MILINIFFAETNRSYDFRVDSSVPVGQVLTDMVNLIAQQDHLLIDQNPGVFLLCRKGTHEIFAQSASLADYGVQSGDELMLI